MRGTFVVVGLVAAGLVAASSEGFAKPKKTSLGCTMSQIQQAAQTPAGQACSKRQDDSVINNTTFIAFVCTSAGVFCCPVDASSQSECTQISSASISRAQTLNAILASGRLRAVASSSRTQATPGATTTRIP